MEEIQEILDREVQVEVEAWEVEKASKEIKEMAEGVEMEVEAVLVVNKILIELRDLEEMD